MSKKDEEKLLKRLTEESPMLKGNKNKEVFLKKLIDKYQKGLVVSSSENKMLKMGTEAIKDKSTKTIDEGVKKKMTKLLGEDFSDVRIHTGEFAQEVAKGVGAKAFTVNDKDIFFAKGEYQPTSKQGVGLIAHELAHVQEKRQGIFPSLRQPHSINKSEQRADLFEKLAREEELDKISEKDEKNKKAVSSAENIKKKGPDMVALKRQLKKQILEKLHKDTIQERIRKGLI